MRICAIGNSFVGAIKNGWDIVRPRYPSVDLVFFASPKDRIAAIELKDGALVPANDSLRSDLTFTSGGRQSIVIRDYDAFLLYGLQFHFRGLRLPQGLSSAVINAVLHDRYVRTINYRIAATIRGQTAAPIVAAPVPLRAEPMNVDSGSLTYSEVIGLMNAQFREQGITFVGQPAETITNEWQTKHEFTKGSFRLGVDEKTAREQHIQNDFGHMNPDFGTASIPGLLASLGVACENTPIDL